MVTFNLDEYLPMPKESEQSYHYFMHHHLFDHIDIDPKNIHIPDGTLEGDEIDKFCRDYEKAIDAAGELTSRYWASDVRDISVLTSRGLLSRPRPGRCS